MAKIYGLFGSMKGKVADVVMAVRNGEQIVRKYQPVVSNPSTPAQVAVRAKMKLLSQLSAVMAPVIAMPRVGAVSSRNMFTKENYVNATYANNQADITLLGVKLTKGILSMPPLNATREGTNVTVRLRSGVSYNRVVYSFFAKQNDNTLRYVTSSVVSEPGNDGYFPAVVAISNLPLVIYAYGVRDNNDAARAAFGNLQVVTAETVAKVIVSRVLKESDITLTETVAFNLPAGE